MTGLSSFFYEQFVLPYRYFQWLRTMFSYYIFLNIFTFLLFGYDKFVARAERRRIPELVLHSLTVMGGIVGAWLGMTVFRHKVRLSGFVLGSSESCSTTALRALDRLENTPS